MFITVGIVASLAIAGYLGYKNKEQVFWNGVKLYDTIKDYCYKYQDNFKIDTIIVYNGKSYFNVESENWKKVPFYLMGFCDMKSPEYENSELCLSYYLHGKKYCKIYHLFPDNKEADYMIDDIFKLEKYNNSKKKTHLYVNFILSATYFNGFKEFDVTELLQMFDIDGEFYKINEYITFDKILDWCNKTNLCGMYKEEYYYKNNENKRFIEIVNLFGEFEKFSPTDILNFNK